jgi:hypothetical protein
MVRNFESMDARIIGERLRELRGDKSVVETAKALDISPSTCQCTKTAKEYPVITSNSGSPNISENLSILFFLPKIHT